MLRPSDERLGASGGSGPALKEPCRSMSMKSPADSSCLLHSSNRVKRSEELLSFSHRGNRLVELSRDGKDR